MSKELFDLQKIKFQKASGLKAVGFWENLYLTGLIRMLAIDDERYAVWCEDKCFEIDRESIRENNSLERELSSPDARFLSGKVIAFSITECRVPTFYFCVTFSDGTPVLVFRKNATECLLSISAKYKTNPLSGRSIAIGDDTLDKLVCNTVRNKVLNFDKPFCAPEFLAKIEKLTAAIKRSNIPNSPDEEKNRPIPEGVSYGYCNKLFLTAYLNNLKESNYSKPQMYFNGSYTEAEEKVKKILQFYKKSRKLTA